MICRLCGKKAEPEPGWMNISDLMYPLCKEHMEEYKVFKEDLFRRLNT